MGDLIKKRLNRKKSNDNSYNYNRLIYRDKDLLIMMHDS